MSRFRVFVLFAFLFVLLSAFSSLSADDVSICPSELTVEMLANPLGIDTQAPRLGWKCAGTREGYGFEQSAYRIVAASTADRLDDDTPDLWDSGWVESSESIQIPYDGKKLSSDTKVFWKVRIKDQDGNISPWSQPASWTTGILTPDDWKGKWIDAFHFAVSGQAAIDRIRKKREDSGKITG